MSLALADYRLRDPECVLTPALLVYPRYVDANIDAALRVTRGDASRWRPHLKTAKMPWVIRRLIERGVNHFKCATTRELLVACECGAADVLLAYAVTGALARRALQIAAEFPATRVSVLAENAVQVEAWIGSDVGVFVDVNPGMDRTGIAPDAVAEIVRLAQMCGDQFRGIHFYDGHANQADAAEREQFAHAGYRELLAIVEAMEGSGIPVGEVITSGTPAFPGSMTFEPFVGRGFVHRASPGTIVFNDVASLGQLASEWGFRAAAVVAATVVSRPLPSRVTCNGGHKSVSADAGVPTCLVIGWPDLQPGKPSEEHLPIDGQGGHVPAIGETLYLLPRHICPTVNLFEDALMVDGGEIVGVEPITARGHERTLLEVEV